MSLLELRAVQAGYGPIQILHGVSLHVDAGEVVAVIGPNGAGKSTTFKAVMGFITFLGGEVVFDGQSLVGLSPDRILARGLAYVPQGRVVFTQMTVRENLEMGAYLERDPAKVREAMEYVFTLFPRLGERRRQLAGSMSGGEQQMLAMGRGLMMRPKMMMLDEPCSGLSRGERQLLTDLLLALPEGLTLIVIEHDMDVALTVAERVTMMHNGRVIVEGTPDEIRGNTLVHDLYLGRHHQRDE